MVTVLAFDQFPSRKFGFQFQKKKSCPASNHILQNLFILTTTSNSVLFFLVLTFSEHVKMKETRTEILQSLLLLGAFLSPQSILFIFFGDRSVLPPFWDTFISLYMILLPQLKSNLRDFHRAAWRSPSLIFCMSQSTELQQVVPLFIQTYLNLVQTFEKAFRFDGQTKRSSTHHFPCQSVQEDNLG